MIIIVGVDPGESCGLAVLKDGSKQTVMQASPDDVIELIALLIAGYKKFNDVRIRVACEKYVITPSSGRKSGGQTLQAKITGAVERDCARYDVPFHEQPMSSVKKMVTNANLKKLGLYVTPSEVNRPDADDANDAMRHAVYCAARYHATLFHQMVKQFMN